MSLSTVQNALDDLARDGFVSVRNGVGTTVAANPPHLSRYGLVFPWAAKADRPWPRYWTALANEVSAIATEPAIDLPVFCDRKGRRDTGDYVSLLRDMEAQRLAGLIFPAQPAQFMGTPVLDMPNLPRVIVMQEPNFPGIPIVALDWQAFIDKALDYLAARGRRRIAVFTFRRTISVYDDAYARGIAHRGLHGESFWRLGLNPEGESARRSAHLLMRAAPQDRPDGLVVQDDNLVPEITAGLLESGVRVPEDVEVVAHANFRWLTPSAVPATRLGFDIRQLLQICVESIASQRRGQCPPPITIFKPVFEDEWEPQRIER